MWRAVMVSAVALAAMEPGLTTAVDALPRCVMKTANGTGPTAEVAQFQVYEALLASVDSRLWAAWMATGATPGYLIKPAVYVCRKGQGLGVSCRGHASICKR